MSREGTDSYCLVLHHTSLTLVHAWWILVSEYGDYLKNEESNILFFMQFCLDVVDSISCKWSFWTKNLESWKWWKSYMAWRLLACSHIMLNMSHTCFRQIYGYHPSVVLFFWNLSCSCVNILCHAVHVFSPYDGVIGTGRTELTVIWRHNYQYCRIWL